MMTKYANLIRIIPHLQVIEESYGGFADYPIEKIA